jgi:uncharacterized membrane protein YraQ (UPF0718 family)
MNVKTVFLTIIGAILIGIVIFFITQKFPLSQGSQTISPKNLGESEINLPTPSPKPSQPPIDKNTNLKEEMSKFDPPDYAEEFKGLRAEVTK